MSAINARRMAFRSAAEGGHRQDEAAVVPEAVGQSGRLRSCQESLVSGPAVEEPYAAGDVNRRRSFKKARWDPPQSREMMPANDLCQERVEVSM
ncbi:hypothetical protein KEM60_01069 [Austwickia sp. TVS 96-490-7B]|nr:hypothetical protein [Austwickia sp. TVS 96-490-7B]